MWYYFDEEGLAAVKEVLDTGSLCAIGEGTSLRFETAFGEEFGLPRGRPTNSWTCTALSSGTKVVTL